MLLAIYYEPNRNPGDIFVFEVIDGFGSDTIDEERKLFEVAYASTPSFQMNAGQKLRLILTNPQELAVACRDEWPLLVELRDAIASGRAVTIYADPARPELEASLHA
ncbi:MAG: hypothetical protein WBD40_22815 [Tepidisphaeraceae bacterium]